MKYLSSNQGGFSLVEVLVAVTILLLVMAGPMRVLTSATNSTTYSSEQIVAYFLAQEGLELVQQGRDNQALVYFQDVIYGAPPLPSPWSQFATNFTDCIPGPCGVTPINTGQMFAVTPCSTLTDCRLYLNATAGDRARYTHTSTGNTVTPYTRTIQISMITVGGRIQGAVATSTVTWRTGSLIADQRVELVTYLTNVYDTN